MKDTLHLLILHALPLLNKAIVQGLPGPGVGIRFDFLDFEGLGVGV